MPEGQPCLLMPEEFSRVVCSVFLSVPFLLFFSLSLILFELGSCQDRHPRANKKSNYTSTCACNLDCLHEGGLCSYCHYATLSGRPNVSVGRELLFRKGLPISQIKSLNAWANLWNNCQCRHQKYLLILLLLLLLQFLFLFQLTRRFFQ